MVDYHHNSLVLHKICGFFISKMNHFTAYISFLRKEAKTL